MWRPALRLPGRKLRPYRRQLATFPGTWAPEEHLCNCQLASGTGVEGERALESHLASSPASGLRPGAYPGRRALALYPRWGQAYSSRWLHGKTTPGAMQLDSSVSSPVMTPEQFALMSTLSSIGPELQLPEAFQLPEAINQELVGAMHRALLDFTHACKAGKRLQLQLHHNQWAEAELAESEVSLAARAQGVAEQLSSALEERIHGEVAEQPVQAPAAQRRKSRPTKAVRPAPAEPEPARDRPELDQWGREVDAVLPFAGHQVQEEDEESRLRRENRELKSEAIRQRHAQFYERIERQRSREMEAHQRAATEYQELLAEMSVKKLGANLPVGKALMLSWFAPLRDAIKAEQEVIKNGCPRGEEYRQYAGHILPLSPEVLAVVVSHRIVELLLEEHGRHGQEDKGGSHKFFPRSEKGHLSFVKMVTAASAVGRAVEMEVKVSNFLVSFKQEVHKSKPKRPTKARGKAGKGTKQESPAEPPLAEAHVEASENSRLGAEGATQGHPPWIPGVKKGKMPTKEEAKAMFEKDKARAAHWAQEEESWDDALVLQVGSLLIELLLGAAKVPEDLLSRGGKKCLKMESGTDGSSSDCGKEDKAASSSAEYTSMQKVFDATPQERESWRPGIIHDHVFLQEPWGDALDRKNKRYGAICCTDEVKAMIDNAANGFIPTMPYMPMLVKPRKWRSPNSGGHLMLPCSVMRTHGAKEQRRALKRAGDKMDRVYQALNVLGETPWRINQPVADVMEQLWEKGGNVAGLVSRFDETVLELSKAEAQKMRTENPEAWRSHIKSKKKAEKINAERHSLRSDMKLKLEVMRDFRKEERFFYPHNLDFRGRAYPMHPHLNHLGADPSRGVLEFAEGRPLGPKGLYWLKVHLANVIGGGVDKLSFEDRVAYANENMDHIQDSAKRPLDGEQWWMKAEDPFQCLATCINIVDAIDSGNPETFVSHLPVHQDGSCNGLQHYAALGRDLAGAQSVNMTCTAKPSDVYTGISQIVKKIVAKDASSQGGKADLAKYLVGHVDRKLVKQTVMTSVYGVTFVGARGQIHNRIKEKGIIADDGVAYKVACYGAKVTLDALSEMFFSARHIMTWLAECARLIASENKTVEWVTPMGLPVVQPYRKASTKQIRTTLQSITIADPNHEKVSVSRQRSAFPPNFVHSLDSSHMMRTAVACKARGLHFAGVHDSFWTHAGNVDELNEILRREFVALHSQPILEDLLKRFREQHPQIPFPEVPDRGDLDLNEVLRAPYFFS